MDSVVVARSTQEMHRLPNAVDVLVLLWNNRATQETRRRGIIGRYFADTLIKRHLCHVLLAIAGVVERDRVLPNLPVAVDRHQLLASRLMISAGAQALQALWALH